MTTKAKPGTSLIKAVQMSAKKAKAPNVQPPIDTGRVYEDKVDAGADVSVSQMDASLTVLNDRAIELFGLVTQLQHRLIPVIDPEIPYATGVVERERFNMSPVQMRIQDCIDNLDSMADNLKATISALVI